MEKVNLYKSCPKKKKSCLVKKKKKYLRTWEFSSIKQFNFLSLVFSPFQGENFGEKTLGFHHLFSFLPIQLNTFQKGFSSYFLSKVFHLLYFTSKQTHHLVVNFDRGTNSRCYINGSHIICNLCKYYIVGPFVASC